MGKLEAGRAARGRRVVQGFRVQKPDQRRSPWPSSQDGFRKVKMSRVLEPFLPFSGGVGAEFGEEDREGEEGWGVEVPP